MKTFRWLCRLCWRWLCTHKYLAIFPVYMIIYLIWFFSLSDVAFPNALILHSRLDDLIPFCEYFIIPYGSWFLALVFTPLVVAFISREDFLRLCFVMYVGMTIALITYMVYPTGLDLREPMVRDNMFTHLVQMIRDRDDAYCVCPSIHVSSSVAIMLVMLTARGLKGKKCAKIIKTIMRKGHVWQCKRWFSNRRKIYYCHNCGHNFRA